jgi:saccharopine dehydrogenase-like NADP-dependent oxidoreductase
MTNVADRAAPESCTLRRAEVQMKVIVLGAGRVGEAMVRDLDACGRFDLTVVDHAPEAVGRLGDLAAVRTEIADLSSPSDVARMVSGHDLAVGAVPGPMGFATLRAVIEAGVDIVDISFFEEDPWPLHLVAMDRGVTAVIDCGVAPGCSNLILGQAEASWERVDAFRCYVGGLPVARHWPFEYKAVYSPIDLIAVYTRPARLVEGGDVVTRPALSEVEAIDFDGVGTLEAFNTDGLRTLLKTCNIPEMSEKTLRYPGHCEKLCMLRDSGFFNRDAITVGEASVCPIDVTAELLIPQWQMGPGEEDLTALRVEIEGVVEGERVVRRWNLVDRFDRDSATTSMARTTGYTCTAVVNAMAEGLFSDKGLAPPEIVGRDRRCAEYVIDYLGRRGIVFEVSEQILEPSHSSS